MATMSRARKPVCSSSARAASAKRSPSWTCSAPARSISSAPLSFSARMVSCRTSSRGRLWRASRWQWWRSIRTSTASMASALVPDISPIKRPSMEVLGKRECLGVQGHLIAQAVGINQELLAFDVLHATRFGQLHGERIAVYAVDQKLIVQVRASGQAAFAYIADGLPLAHTGAIAHAAGEAAHVCVQRTVLLAMFDDHGVAVAAFHANKFHSSIAGCTDRRAGRCSVVHTAVGTQGVQDRMATVRVEARTDAREFYRRADKGTAQRVAVQVEEVDVAFFRFVAKRDQVTTTVVEFGHGDIAHADFLAIQI